MRRPTVSEYPWKSKMFTLIGGGSGRASNESRNYSRLRLNLSTASMCLVKEVFEVFGQNLGFCTRQDGTISGSSLDRSSPRIERDQCS